MNLFYDILVIVLPVFLVIGTGSVLKWTRLVDAGFLFQLNRMVYYLALPALLFYKISTADFSASFNGDSDDRAACQYQLPVLSSPMPTVCCGPIRLRSAAPLPRGPSGEILPISGLPSSINACGEKGLASAGILLGFLVPAMNFLAIVALLMPYRNGGQRMGAGVWIRQIGGNPLIIASFIGIAWSFFRLPMPKVMGSALHIITDMALPLALISIGASFSWEKLRGDLKVTMLATGIKLVVHALFGRSGVDPVGCTGAGSGHRCVVCRDTDGDGCLYHGPADARVTPSCPVRSLCSRHCCRCSPIRLPSIA